MRIFATRLRVVALPMLMVAWGALTYACNVEDENPASTRQRDAGSTTDDGSVSPTNDPSAPTGAPLCPKVGGYDGVTRIASAILTQVKADCRVGGPLATLSTDDMRHFEECFAIQLGGAFQCPGVTYVSNTTADSKNQKCRDMTAAHKGMNLRSADFDAFVEDVVKVLGDNQLSTDDVKSVLPVFVGVKTGVVQNASQPDRNTYCTCSDPSPGQYQGKPCAPEAGATDAGPTTDASDASDAADAPADG